MRSNAERCESAISIRKLTRQRHSFDVHSVSFEDNVIYAREKEGRKKEVNEELVEGKRACLLPLAPSSQTVTNGLFHARSMALTRHRYSVRRGGWESSSGTDIDYPSIPGTTCCPQRTPSALRATTPRHRRWRRQRERSDGRSIGLYSRSGSLFRAVKFHEASFPLIESCRVSHANIEISRETSEIAKWIKLRRITLFMVRLIFWYHFLLHNQY